MHFLPLQFGFTALMYATAFGNYDTAMALVSSGADTEAKEFMVCGDATVRCYSVFWSNEWS